MHRKVGVAAIKRKKDEANQFSAVGKNLEENKISFVRDVFEKFKISLTEFAEKHRDRINSDPEFRMNFNSMCNSVGVDPLTSNKGFWADMLGYGDFYFELGVKIIQICMKQRSQSGGIISLDELLKLIKKRQDSRNGPEISEEDVKRAVSKLQILGSGFRIYEINGKSMVISVPMELNKDHEEIFTVASMERLIGIDAGHAFVSEDMMINAGWSVERFHLTIQPLLRDGNCWIDIHMGQTRYYFPWLA